MKKTNTQNSAVPFVTGLANILVNLIVFLLTYKHVSLLYVVQHGLDITNAHCFILFIINFTRA